MASYTFDQFREVLVRTGFTAVRSRKHVILPKKLRENLQIKELVAIEVGDHSGIVRKPVLSSDKLAGCFKAFASRKKRKAGLICP